MIKSDLFTLFLRVDVLFCCYSVESNCFALAINVPSTNRTFDMTSIIQLSSNEPATFILLLWTFYLKFFVNQLHFFFLSKVHPSIQTNAYENMFKRKFVFQLLLLVAFVVGSLEALSQKNEPTKSGGKSERKLSRKRRYLIFPSGSSIQLGKKIHTFFKT